METIFHEKQEGSLCAQHCLNALLQGSYFSAVDLAEIAKQLDEQEKATMAEAGLDTAEYRQFLNQASTNFDDSGFFSIQVLQQALRVWDLDLVPYNSSDDNAKTARSNPLSQQAYICNFKEHWFTIRKLGNQWFNLNSMFKRPELVSDTYLHMLLLQLQQEGYSIFIVNGTLPECEADQLLKVIRVEAVNKPYNPKLQKEEDLDPELQAALEESRNLAEKSEGGQIFQQAMTASGRSINEEDLRKALAESLGNQPSTSSDEDDLQRAIQLSLQADQEMSASGGEASKPLVSKSAAQQAPTPTAEEIRKRRLEFLEKQSNQNKPPG